MLHVLDPGAVRFGPAAWFFLVALCLLLPVAALRQHQAMRTAEGAAGLGVTRTRIYVSGLVTHAALLLLVGAVWLEQRFDLFAPYRPTAMDAAIGLVALAVGLLPLLPRFRLDDPVAQERSRLIAPRSARDFALFYVVALSAGFAEEVAYRGVLFTLVAALAGSWWIAAIVGAAAFGVVHLFQGRKTAAIAGLMGFRDHLVVGLTGTLFIAIVVHMFHDIIAGTVIGLRARRGEPEENVLALP
jgi:membrane protease YdiL (CAAX protease family)